MSSAAANSTSATSAPAPVPARRWVCVSELNWPVIFLVYSLLALISTGTSYYSSLADRHPRPFLYPFIWEFSGYFIGFFLCPLVVTGFSYLRIQRANWHWTVPVHVAISMALGAIHTFLMGVSRQWIYGWLQLGPYDYGDMNYRYLMEYHKQFISYWIICVVLVVWAHFRDSRERERQAAALELRASELQRQLAQVQLQALRAQLNPHFLFNTLNMVSSVMYEDAARADRMLAALSQMLRLALEEGAGECVPLRHELEFIECGATLLRARFQDRLEIAIDCPETVRGALVPNLLWHTLIENAVKHHPGGRGTVIRVQACAEWADGWLHLHVRDNGPGITDLPQAMRRGVGLRNTQQRLQALYGPEHRLEFTNLPEGGLHAHAAFPATLAA